VTTPEKAAAVAAYQRRVYAEALNAVDALDVREVRLRAELVSLEGERGLARVRVDEARAVMDAAEAAVAGLGPLSDPPRVPGGSVPAGRVGAADATIRISHSHEKEA